MGYLLEIYPAGKVETMGDRPQCHRCTHKGILPGDAHIQCLHPKAQANMPSDPIAAMAEAFITGAAAARVELGIVGGGDTWPANFNPGYLEQCNGYTPKGEA
ncbi:MAG: hypothetical protein GY906_08630 [bacterium]|nr:hypothetical protein [bacterium]